MDLDRSNSRSKIDGGHMVKSGLDLAKGGRTFGTRQRGRGQENDQPTEYEDHRSRKSLSPFSKRLALTQAMNMRT